MKKAASLLLLVFSLSTLFSQNQNISNGNVFDGEPYLAVNPANSQHLVIAWMGWINLANRFKIKVTTSFDAGQTWSTAVELPHTVSTYSSADPCIGFNHLGEVFVSYIDFTGTTPPVTGAVVLCKSTDGGLSFNPPTAVINTSFDGTKWPIDRPWMVIDNSSGSSQGTIYVTSMNLNRTNAPFNPYLSVSTDNGISFSTRYLDTINYLAGSLNNLPMPSPSMTSNGTFYSSYPSYVVSQSFFAQSMLVSSTNQGNSLNHSVLSTINPASNVGNYPNAKKASLLLSNPVNANHLAYIYLNTTHGDIDVFLIETTNAGTSWSAPIRLNDDPIGNNRMQDLIWGDFDSDGDLVVSWRDRRNGTDSTFETQTEIWATFRSKDSSGFEPNFQITSQTVAYDSILESAGNDFMCIKLQNDTIHATWGDPRTTKLNIWYQSLTTDGRTLSLKQISSEAIPKTKIFPNPALNEITLQGFNMKAISIFDLKGKLVFSKTLTNKTNQTNLNIERLTSGSYVIQIETEHGIDSQRIVKQ